MYNQWKNITFLIYWFFQNHSLPFTWMLPCWQNLRLTNIGTGTVYFREKNEETNSLFKHHLFWTLLRMYIITWWILLLFFAPMTFCLKCLSHQSMPFKLLGISEVWFCLKEHSAGRLCYLSATSRVWAGSESIVFVIVIFTGVFSSSHFSVQWMLAIFMFSYSPALTLYLSCSVI